MGPTLFRWLSLSLSFSFPLFPFNYASAALLKQLKRQQFLLFNGNNVRRNVYYENNNNKLVYDIDRLIRIKQVK